MGSVLLDGARTPIGKFLGAFADIPATELGGYAIAEALQRSKVDARDVDYVIMGQVLQAGVGQAPARQAAVRAGIAMNVPSLTINKVCLSGLNAVALADQLIRAGVRHRGGRRDGVDDLRPHLLPKSRTGIKYGTASLLDHMAADGLWDVYTDQSMGALTDAGNCGEVQVSRADQDAFAARSHQRAAAATASGVMAEELVEVKVPQRRGPDRLVATDEGIREGVTAESLAGLPPAFAPDGTITAASSSPISDGAAALIVASAEAAERLGVAPLAEVRAHGMVAARTPPCSCSRPRPSGSPVAKEQIGIRDLDLIEINEAFAAVGVASARALGLNESETDEKVNINGGAIALGHPIGASGARLVLTLAYALRRRGGGTGVASLCGGGGQGDALILRSL